MNLSNTEQIFKAIDDKKSILIILDKNYNGDVLASTIALGLYLKKYGKKVSIATEDINVNKKYQFLAGLDLLTDKVTDPTKFTISISTTRVKAKELSYEPKEDKIEIYLTSATENGFKKEDVEIIENNVDFDLVFTIGVRSKSVIGNIYENNKKFIDDKPLVNIDIDPKNVKFGDINFVEDEQSTISELIFDIIGFNKSELIDENIATCLLTGIIEKTNGFKTPDLSPSTMSTVSNLMDLGADRENIISNLFRTKTVDEVKVWAKILANTKASEDGVILYSSNENIADFDIKSIFVDIISEIKNAEIFIIFNKKDDIVYAQVTTSGKYNALELTQDFRSIGNSEVAQFAIASNDLEKVVEVVLSKLSAKV